MNILRRLYVLLITAMLVTTTCLAAAPQKAEKIPAQSLSQTIPTDPEITIGKLDNGLRYYIRANKKPEKRAELRLVVKAGSVLEDDDQQGLAHFVEHMAFNGTAHFPKNDIVSFIESIGMRFGTGLNAGTSFDETTYRLTVPTDKSEVIDKAFLIMEDWAHNVTFDATELDKERGVIIEELRLSRGAGRRLTEKLLPVLLKGSRYADRIPLGKAEIIQGSKPEQLKRFYADWYRPDLMAVVAVGDFDKAAIEAMIRKHFAAIPVAVSPRLHPIYDIPDHPGTIYTILTDKEVTSTSIEVYNLLPTRKQGSIDVYRQDTVDRLFSSMLNARFSELTQKPDAPFISAGAGRGAFVVRTKDNASLSAQVKEDGIERGLDALFTEVERVSRFGFTATELNRQKEAILINYQRQAVESRNQPSSSRAAEYIRNFVQNESLPSVEVEYALHQQFLPGITLEEINKIAREWFSDQNRFVVVAAPEKSGLVIPDETKLAAVMKSAMARDLKPYVDSVSSAVLLDNPPQPGTVIKTSTKDATGITEWELSNGVKVVLKPTTFKEDEILFRATSPGGTSLASDKDFIPADTATIAVSSGGLGKFSAIDLQKIMLGKAAGASPLIGELDEGMSGSSSRKDLETMFQLIYLLFTQPRYDMPSFKALESQLKNVLANQTANPAFAYAEMLIKTLSQDHPRRYLPSPAIIDQFDLDKSMAFYKDRFADAGDFTFVFVGSFDLGTMKPLVERYLGGLPVLHRKEMWKDVGVMFPKGIVEKTVTKGIEPKSQSSIVFSGPFLFDMSNRVAIRAMAQVLQMRLLKTIREDLGGTYSISATQSFHKIPRSEYSITIEFGSDPQRTNDLIKRVFQEIVKLRTEGPTEKELNDEKEALLREFETSSKLNGFLVAQYISEYQIGEDPAVLLEFPDYVRKLSVAAIMQSAKTYLNLENYVQVSLFPEKK
jgi:zinc protease